MKPKHPGIQVCMGISAYLSWTWSALRAVFVLKARPSWVKLKRHKWKRLRGFTVRVLFNQTNKQNVLKTVFKWMLGGLLGGSRGDMRRVCVLW